MLNPSVANVVGTPNESVTHWGLYRKRETPYASGRDKWIALTHADDAGVLQKLWPLEELSPALVRERWGAGTFQCYWVTLDPENPQQEHRRIDQGKGVVFGIQELPKQEEPDDDEPRGATDPLTFAMRYADEQQKRTMSQFEVFARLAGLNGGGGGGGASGTESAALAAIAELRAELAEQRAKSEAAEERRRIEDAHRRDLEAKEQEIARLRRELEDDRRDADAPPRFDPEVPIGQQLLAAAANLAMTNPAGLGALISVAQPLLKGFLPGGGSSPPPAPSPAMAAPRPIPVAVAQPMPRAPVATPIGQVFVPPPATELAPAPVTTPIGQVFPLPTPRAEPTKDVAPEAEAVAELA